MHMARPYPWERSYPPNVRWDAPILQSTLPALLVDAVARFGALPVLEFRDRQISYADLARRVDQVAAGLRRLGIAPGQSVALYLPNTPYHPIAFFAILRAGARVVHLSPLDAPRVLAHKLADSGARTVITTDLPGMLPTALRLLREGRAERLIVGEDAAWGTPSPSIEIPDASGVLRFADILVDEEPPAWVATPDDVALLQYTGGTTGLPRAAMLTHGNLTAALSIYEAWGVGNERAYGPGDRTIGVLPLFHIYSLTVVLLRSIRAGAEILLRPQFDAAAVLDDIEQKRATYFYGVPTMWIALAGVSGLERRDLSSLRYVGSGGAPLPADVSARFAQLTGQHLAGGWGMTETSPAGTGLVGSVAFKPGMIGLPLPGIVMDVASLDDPRLTLASGEVGEIRIKGPNVTVGYWNRPDETARAFADGFLLTGDVGYMDEDGCFFLVDRKKDMIISGGFNVYPRMIEDAIYEHPDVLECAVIGIADAYRGQAAKAFVTLRDGAQPFTLDALKAFLAERVGRHEMPVAVEIRDSLPKTPVGKLWRRQLADEERLRTPASADPM